MYKLSEGPYSSYLIQIYLIQNSNQLVEHGKHGKRTEPTYSLR